MTLQRFYDAAARAINARIDFREDKLIDRRFTRFVVSLRPSDPRKTALYVATAISEEQLAADRTGDVLDRYMEKSVSQLLTDALNQVDQMHRLRRSFLARLKFLFNTTLP